VETGQIGLDRPHSPLDAALERDRSALEPEPVVLADRLDAAAEVDALRTGLRCDQLGERGREARRLAGEPEQVLGRGGMELREQGQDLAADQAALRGAIRRVDPELEPHGAAVGLRLLAP
jgi:hypothetical protein